MASFATASASPDAVITVKINYDGCTRRAKMVLRDMIPQQLEQQVSSTCPSLILMIGVFRFVLKRPNSERVSPPAC